MSMRAFTAMLPWLLAVLNGLWAAPPVFGQPIDVLTLNGTRTDNPFGTSAGYSQLRSDLQNPANFGPGGVVPRTVQSINSVPTITTSSLSGVEVVILIGVGSLLPAENSALSAFLNGGGGLLVADNNAALILQPLLGVTPGGFTSSGTAVVSNPSSPLVTGPFGSFGAGTTISAGFAGSFATGGLTPAGTGAITNDAGFYAASFTSGNGRVAAFTDEELFANSGLGGGGGALLTPTTEAIFLNSFAYVAPVPEPSSGLLICAVGAGGFAWCRRRRTKRCN